MPKRPRRLNVRCDVMHWVLSLTRSRRWANRVVYVVCANKKFRELPRGEKYGSRILYIGETSIGKIRPANSACWKADKAFGRLHGVKRLDVHLVACRGRKGVEKIWKKLESSLIAAFVLEHHRPPFYNRKWKNAKVAKYFREARLMQIIRSF